MDIASILASAPPQAHHLPLSRAGQVSPRAPATPENARPVQFHITVKSYKSGLVSSQGYPFSDFKDVSLVRGVTLPTRVYILRKPLEVEVEENSNILSKEQTIIDRLAKAGCFDVSRKLFEVFEDVAEDPDEVELVPESLESMADFFLARQVPPASISMHDGTLTASWRLPHTLPPSDGWNNSDGYLFLRFLPSGMFICVMETRAINNHEGAYIADEMTLDEVIERTKPFFARLRRNQ